MVRLDNDSAAALVALLRNQALPEEIRLAVGSMQEQLDRPQFHGEVVERLAEIVARPNARSILSGEALVRMRRALLSPREMAELEATTRKGVGCINCGRKIASHELCTIDGMNIYCYRCIKPAYLSCKCGDLKKLDLNAKILRTQRECKLCHRIEKGEAPAAPADPLLGDARDAALPQWRAGRLDPPRPRGFAANPLRQPQARQFVWNGNQVEAAPPPQPNFRIEQEAGGGARLIPENPVFNNAAAVQAAEERLREIAAEQAQRIREEQQREFEMIQQMDRVAQQMQDERRREALMDAIDENPFEE